MPPDADLRLVWNNPNPDLENVAFRFRAPEMSNSSALAAFSAGDFVTQATKADLKSPDQAVPAGDAMADPTREEFDAKLATVEARAETRFTELGGKIDRVADSIMSLGSTMRSDLDDLRGEMRVVRSDNKFTRISIIVAMVASVLAGIGALWLTQANLLAAFQAGLSVHETPTSQPPNNRR